MAVWRFERWQDGVREVVTDDRAGVVSGPGVSDPDVDPLVLRWMWSQSGVSDVHIVQRLGVSARTVQRRAFALGLPSRMEAQRDGCDRIALLELWRDATVTKAAICERLDITPAQLGRLAQRLDLPERSRASKRARRPRPVGASAPDRSSARIVGEATVALRVANQRRSEAALESMLERTRAALTVPDTEVPQHLRDAGELRLRHPQASLASLAELGGCSKDVLTGRLRRLWQLVDTETSRPHRSAGAG
jgi:hypothetical protein